MKTGNAILGVFCFWMAFTLPFKTVELMTTLSLESVMPFSNGLSGLVIFAFFITAGLIALTYGRERDVNKITFKKTFGKETSSSKEALRKITGDEKLTDDDLF